MKSARGKGRPLIEGDLRPLIEKHHGCMRAMGAELGISRQAMKQRLVSRGLYAATRKLAGASGVPGANPHGMGKREARRIRSAVRRCASLTAAASALGMHRDRLRRRMKKYGITVET